MMRHTLTTAAALFIIAACGGNSDQPKDPVPPTSTTSGNSEEPDADVDSVDPQSVPARAETGNAEPSADTVIDVDQEMLTASARIDGRIADFAPALSQRIKADIELALEKAELIAASDAEEGFDTAHDYQYEFEKVASVGDIISVEFLDMVYTGGAHPNYLLGGILHDRAAGEDIFPSEILTEAGTAAMKTLLLEKLAEEKRIRLSMDPQDMPAIREDVADVFPKEIEFWFGQVVFHPSTEADKFGGLTVLFSPYDVGSYAEGGYELRVSASELDGMLNDRFAPMFGGEPVIKEDEN